MYCVKCGVKLSDTESKCPLCNTAVFHPDIEREQAEPLYPKEKMPDVRSRSRALNGAILILFIIPLAVCLFADLSFDGAMEWFGYVVCSLTVAYVIFALPLWFKKPNPVIFVPCDFAAVALLLLYVNIATGGNWFLTFALPITGAVALITCALVTLLYYLKRGVLYITGGATLALGLLMPLIEFLLLITFNLKFIGWSTYPLVVLLTFGALLIYVAINRSAQEILKRKLFF